MLGHLLPVGRIISHKKATPMSALHRLIIGFTFLAAASAQYAFAQAPKTAASKSLDHGRYLVKIAGCNDCHTSGYAQTGGRVPEKQWLTGTQVGWRGPWGTTYPTNLRLFLQSLSEEQWVKMAKTAEFRTPMPWFALYEMTN